MKQLQNVLSHHLAWWEAVTLRFQKNKPAFHSMIICRNFKLKIWITECTQNWRVWTRMVFLPAKRGLLVNFCKVQLELHLHCCAAYFQHPCRRIVSFLDSRYSRNSLHVRINQTVHLLCSESAKTNQAGYKNSCKYFTALYQESVVIYFLCEFTNNGLQLYPSPCL